MFLNEGKFSNLARLIQGNICSIEPMTALAIAGIVNAAGNAIKGYSDVKAAEAQGEALGSAQSAAAKEAKRLRQLQERFLKIQEQLIAEGAPLREAQRQAAIQSIEELQQFAGTPAGESAQFKQDLSRGTEALAGQFSRFGLGDSGAQAIGLGRFGENLLSADRAQRLQVQHFLAGGAPSTLGAAQGFGGLGLGAAGQSTGALGQSLQAGVAGGAVQAGLASSLGGLAGGSVNQLGGIPLTNQILQNSGLLGQGGSGSGILSGAVGQQPTGATLQTGGLNPAAFTLPTSSPGGLMSQAPTGLPQNPIAKRRILTRVA